MIAKPELILDCYQYIQNGLNPKYLYPSLKTSVLSQLRHPRCRIPNIKQNHPPANKNQTNPPTNSRMCASALARFYYTPSSKTQGYNRMVRKIKCQNKLLDFKSISTILLFMQYFCLIMARAINI